VAPSLHFRRIIWPSKRQARCHSTSSLAQAKSSGLYLRAVETIRRSEMRQHKVRRIASCLQSCLVAPVHTLRAALKPVADVLLEMLPPVQRDKEEYEVRVRKLLKDPRFVESLRKDLDRDTLSSPITDAGKDQAASMDEVKVA
jgi:hypothetical protein